MKILITGAAGFIGFHLVKELSTKGHSIIGIDNINDYYDVNLKFARLSNLGIAESEIGLSKVIQSKTYEQFGFLKADLVDKDIIMDLFNREQFDIVINLAAQAGVRYSIENPDAYIQSNVVGFFNILEACRHFKIKHLIYASSSSVYGMNKSIPFSVKNNVDHPVSLYAATKKSNELMAHAYSNLYNIPTTGLRFFTVYGPWGRPDMAYFLFADAIMESKPIKVFNHGNMMRDFTYIDDIIKGIASITEQAPTANPEWDGLDDDPSRSQAPYRIYNIGNNKPVKLFDFINTVGAAFNKSPEMIMLDMQPGDVPATWADIDDLKNDFGYQPSVTIEEGIKRFADWYSEYFALKS